MTFRSEHAGATAPLRWPYKSQGFLYSHMLMPTLGRVSYLDLEMLLQAFPDKPGLRQLTPARPWEFPHIYCYNSVLQLAVVCTASRPLWTLHRDSEWLLSSSALSHTTTVICAKPLICTGFFSISIGTHMMYTHSRSQVNSISAGCTSAWSRRMRHVVLTWIAPYGLSQMMLIGPC